MSFLLRPSILTNHLLMLGCMLFLWLIYFLAAPFIISDSTKGFRDVLEVMFTFIPLFWIIAVAMRLQRWKNDHEYMLVWIAAIVFLLSLLCLPMLRSAGDRSEALSNVFSLLIISAVGVHISLSWQIASHLTKGLAGTFLHFILVLNWPFFLFLFKVRLRKALNTYAAWPAAAG